MYTTFSSTSLKAAFFLSPKLEITAGTNKLCLSFYFFTRKDGGELRVYTIRNGSLFDDTLNKNRNYPIGKWNKRKIQYNNQINQVSLLSLYKTKHEDKNLSS